MSIKQIAIAILSYLIMIVLLILIVNWLLPVEPQQRRTVIDLPPYKVQAIEDTGHNGNY